MKKGLFQILTLGTLIALMANPARAQQSRPVITSSNAAIISLDGEIDDYSRDTFIRRFNAAKSRGAQTVIVDLNTYGGLVTAGLDLSRFLKNQSDVHTIAYVDTKAISAGAMIALACNEIVMAENAVIGDCAPIALSSDGKLQELPAAERAKLESPIIADFRDSALRNGYDVLLAEAMVAVGRSVYGVREQTDSGVVRIVDEKEYKELTQKGWIAYPDARQPIDSAESLLTIHTPQAVALKLATGTAPSADALIARRALTIVANNRTSMGDQLVQWLGNSAVRAILLSIFMLSLYIALHTPGAGAAEAVAMIALALLVGIPLLTGYAQWWEILAIFIGLILIALEIFVIPGFGAAGITGIALVLGGLVMTFVGNAPGLPGTTWKIPQVWTGLQNGLLAVVVAFVVSGGLALWLRRYLPKLPYLNRLVLKSAARPAIAGMGDASGIMVEDSWPFVGTVGKAVSDLKPGGTAEFPYADDRRITAVVSDSGFVAAGTKLSVREVHGSRIVVRPIT
jgi:membrane-bound serine protease (ClpP class)